MGGGRAYESACEVLFEGDCKKLEEATGEEGANVWEAAARRQGDQGRTGLEELLKVLLQIVEGC